ncbi:MAG TPA: VTT domain-containing protein [Firmicutes bacterium]|nr:VTT domain-containing protein [Bacillota bacterium]
MQKKKNRPYWTLLALGLVVAVAAVLVFQILDMDQEAFAARFKDSLAAIPILLGLYLLKAATVVLLPQPLVYLLTGLLFSPLVAFLLTLLFLLMEFSMDYFIGRRFGKKWLDKLLSLLRGRNRILDRLLALDALDRFGSIAALRLLPGISTDSVSLLAGAQNVKFSRYLAASYVGALPQAVTVTLMGASAHDPLSPQFLIPMGVFLLALLVTWAVYRWFTRTKAAGKKAGAAGKDPVCIQEEPLPAGPEEKAPAAGCGERKRKPAPAPEHPWEENAAAAGKEGAEP